ncbi:MAG: hypothetical protein EHM55_24805 [Acidobacteria bacterium]|jgi:hypothetical protein|nr:MAG: hypothetical protein EHM55_24805 [Acidobacteriota bacterium]
MRDVVAALVAAALIFAALSLLTTLHFYRKRHRQAREEEVARGRRIIVELPTDPELTLFTEDEEHFYYGTTPIDKNDIMAVRVLINGSPIAAFVSPRWSSAELPKPTTFDDRPEGIARDRWDVAIETLGGTVLVECGAVRERVSQELARNVFDAVRKDLETRC